MSRKNTHSQTDLQRILNVLVYIENNLNDSLDLKTLSRVANFSAYHFHRFFKNEIGETVQTYVRRLKLERAAKDLAFSDMSIDFIAERAGFEATQAFYGAFKKRYKQTPATFRKNQAEKTNLYLKTLQHEKIPAITIKKMKAFSVAFSRNVGMLDNTALCNAWFKLITKTSINAFLSKKSTRMSMVHDCHEATDMHNMRYDACISLEEIKNFTPSGDVGIYSIKKQTYVAIKHYGSLNTIQETFKVIYRLWKPTCRYEFADGPSLVIHEKLPFQTKDNELVSHIYVPIIRKK